MAQELGEQANTKLLSSVARLRYFFGELLTQRDLEAEQHYHVLMRRLVQREAFGTGTVAGLEVVAEHEAKGHRATGAGDRS
jgi:hypothetical protein